MLYTYFIVFSALLCQMHSPFIMFQLEFKENSAENKR